MNQPDNIVQEVLNNRERGSARLLSEYRDCLYSMALALCRDKAEAEDLVFCTIERAIDKIDTFKNHDSLYSWLCVILVNLYRDSMRKKVNRGTMAVGGATEMEPFTEPVGPDGIVSAIDSGAVTGLYDTVTGDVISNGSSFAFGGAGQDHGQLKAYIKPGYGNNIRSGESTTLTAYAPGATSYRWL